MGALLHFPGDPNETVDGSAFGEPDGTRHLLQVLDGNGRLIIRVQLSGSDKSVDLLLDGSRAFAFAAGVNAAIQRIRLPLEAAVQRENKNG